MDNCNVSGKAGEDHSQRLAVSLRSSIAKRRSHLNAALCEREGLQLNGFENGFE